MVGEASKTIMRMERRKNPDDLTDRPVMACIMRCLAALFAMAALGAVLHQPLTKVAGVALALAALGAILRRLFSR